MKKNRQLLIVGWGCNLAGLAYLLTGDNQPALFGIALLSFALIDNE